MRDIREDLQDRIRECTLEQESLQRQIDEIDARKRLLQTLLEEEYRRWPGDEPGNAAIPSPKLQEMILDIMSDGDTWNGGTVTKIALSRGFNFGLGKPGRIVHFTLLGMSKHGTVENVGEGQWKLVKPRDIKDEDQPLVLAAGA